MLKGVSRWPKGHLGILTMIQFAIDAQLTDINPRQFAIEIERQIIEVNKEAQRIIMRDVLGENGIPVVSGYLKSSFSDIAADLGIPINWKATPDIISKYGEERTRGRFSGYFRSKEGESPKASIVWESRGALATWSLDMPELDNVDAAYPFLNESGANTHPKWAWQKQPPWNHFSGPDSAKNDALQHIRIMLARIFEINIRRMRVKSVRFSSDRPNSAKYAERDYDTPI